METTAGTVELAPLDTYIRRVYGQPTIQIFENASYNDVPSLRRDKVNRIVVYRGCFNPPHLDHKAALCHTFFRAGADLNIVAAFIVHVNDNGVARKLTWRAPDRFPIVFSEKQRVEMWNKAGLNGGWHWCLPGDLPMSTHEFYYALQKEAAADGFAIRFTTMMGPDHVGDPTMNLSYQELITFGRHETGRLSFIKEDPAGLASIHGYGEWENIPLTEAGIDRVASGHVEWQEEKLNMLYPHMMEKLPVRNVSLSSSKRSHDPSVIKHRQSQVRAFLRTCTRRLGNIRECVSTDGKGRWMRFIPLDFIGMKGGAEFLGGSSTVARSSSLIVDIIWEASTKEQLLSRLSGLAVNPTLVVQFVEGRISGHSAPFLKAVNHLEDAGGLEDAQEGSGEAEEARARGEKALTLMATESNDAMSDR